MEHAGPSAQSRHRDGASVKVLILGPGHRSTIARSHSSSATTSLYFEDLETATVSPESVPDSRDRLGIVIRQLLGQPDLGYTS